MSSTSPLASSPRAPAQRLRPGPDGLARGGPQLRAPPRRDGQLVLLHRRQGLGAGDGRVLRPSAVQWSNGRYPDASNSEDDVIIARSAPVLTDDHGGNALTATALPAETTTPGLIGTRSDIDAFGFVASGYTSLAVGGAPGVSDLDVALTVVDAAGDVVASVDPTSDIAQDASLDATWTAALPSSSAVYTAFLSGTGHGDPPVAGR